MKKRKEIITKSAIETRKLGRKVARSILKMKNNKKAIVLALKGDLGAGKTTFLQGFAKGLGIKDKILSPTFVIYKKSQIPIKELSSLRMRKRNSVPLTSVPLTNFYHIDCYRIHKPGEIINLGFKKIISNPKNIVAIEWPERIGKILPKNNLIVSFKFIDDKTRKIVVAE